MSNIKTIFLENKAWVVEKLQSDQSYFADSAKTQNPNYLWIGCSDSRILPNELTGTSVGDLFIHRNIANLIHHDDLNLMAVVTYAVRYLKVKDVIVCGHYGCGGVLAAMGDQSFGIIDQWLKNIKDVCLTHRHELEALPTEKAKFDRLVELNVLVQSRRLTESPIYKELKAESPHLRLHSWVYDMSTGFIKNFTQP